MKLKYVVIKRLSQEEVEAAISKNKPKELSAAVLSASLHSDNPDWAQDVCLRLANHKATNVRAMALQGFGHIARIHGKLTKKLVKPIIETALNDKNDFVRGEADGAADDVEHYLKWKIICPPNYPGQAS